MAKLTDRHIELLSRPVFAHVATVMPDGTPQSTPVWIDTDGEAVLFNTARGRTKARNIERQPVVAISLVNDENPYEMLQLRGRAELIDEGADAHIDRMAKKYLGQDSYPFRQPGEQRVIVRVTPEAIVG
ncbi:MAG: PPOX class F420-dependent oxidoreductase [Actinomycetota bacterium]|nr:PPOX class F420-dependent oxidoreductase [Actinomycetota bacterium]